MMAPWQKQAKESQGLGSMHGAYKGRGKEEREACNKHVGNLRVQSTMNVQILVNLKEACGSMQAASSDKYMWKVHH